MLELGRSKAHSPNGFTIDFWVFTWEVVKEEIMGVFKEFHSSRRFVKPLNAIFLVMFQRRAKLNT